MIALVIGAVLAMMAFLGAGYSLLAAIALALVSVTIPPMAFGAAFGAWVGGVNHPMWLAVRNIGPICASVLFVVVLILL